MRPGNLYFVQAKFAPPRRSFRPRRSNAQSVHCMTSLHAQWHHVIALQIGSVRLNILRRCPGFPLAYSPPSNGHIMAPIAPCNVTSRETFRCTRSPTDTHRTRTHIAAPQHLACFLASRTGERAQFEKTLRLNHWGAVSGQPKHNKIEPICLDCEPCIWTVPYSQTRSRSPMKKPASPWPAGAAGAV